MKQKKKKEIAYCTCTSVWSSWMLFSKLCYQKRNIRKGSKGIKIIYIHNNYFVIVRICLSSTSGVDVLL